MVAHVVRSFGEISESFIVDGAFEVDRLGWESWVVGTTVNAAGATAFPPAERILVGTRPSLPRRVADRLAYRSSSDRRSAWLEPSIAATRPDVIHAHFGWGAADARLAARRLQIPLVATFRGSDLTIFPGYTRLYRDYRLLFRQLERAICISEFLASKLRGYGYARRIDVVPTGTRLEDFPFRGALMPGGELRVLFVGRQVECKGTDVLIRSLAVASQRDPRLSLDVIGDGPMRAANEALARSLGIERRVTFHGAQPRQAIVAGLQAAHIFAMPSLTAASGQTEGLGNVQKEAMAVGVPVVATASGGIPETIPPRHRRDLVEPGNVDALARRLLALAADADNWQERVAHARDWMERKFCWRLLAGRLATIYEEAAAAAADRK